MNWITIAPGAEALAMPLPKNMKASSRPRPGPGLASMRNRTDWPSLAASVVPSGVKTPWLIALLRNRILAGSTKIEASGIRWLSMRKSTIFSAPLENCSTNGPATRKPPIARIIPQMPAEKLLTSISRPGLILPSHISSSLRIDQPPSGPMTIAPRNIGTLAPATAPMVAIAPTTPPRMLSSPYAIRPPV